MLEESGIENGNVWNVEQFACHVDALEVGWVVERAERDEFFDELNNVIVDDNSLIEVLTALNNTMADGFDTSVFQLRADFVEQADNFTQANAVIGNWFVNVGGGAVVLVLDVAFGFTDAFNKAGCDGFTGFWVHELVFDRRRAGIDNENSHFYYVFFLDR